MNSFIYGLIDPRTNQIRYVGQTTSGFGRLKSHMKVSYIKHTINRNVGWMKGLLSSGYKPEMIVIEEAAPDRLDDLEIFYIAYFRMIGANLNNHAEGGVKNRGWKHSEEWKKRMSETKVGKPMPAGHANKIRAGQQEHGGTWSKGKKLSEETKAKMSAAKKGKKPNNFGWRKHADSSTS